MTFGGSLTRSPRRIETNRTVDVELWVGHDQILGNLSCLFGRHGKCVLFHLPTFPVTHRSLTGDEHSCNKAAISMLGNVTTAMTSCSSTHWIG